MTSHFQFRLRTLLIGVTALAVVCWGIVDRQRLIHERDEAAEGAAAMQKKLLLLESERDVGPFVTPHFDPSKGTPIIP